MLESGTHPRTCICRAPEDIGTNGFGLHDQRGSWTHSEFNIAVLSWHGWFAARARRGDRVVICLEQGRDSSAALLGAMRAGLIAVPVGVNSSPAHVQRVLTDCQPVLVVTKVPVFTNQTLLPVVCDANAPCVLLYTSGSTGKAKGVLAGHGQITFTIDAIHERLGYASGDRVWCRLSTSFTYGLYQLHLCIRAGSELFIDTGGPISARGIAHMAKFQPTVVPMIPSDGPIWRANVASETARSNIRLVTTSGEPMGTRLLSAVRQAFPSAQVIPMYGMTECIRITIQDEEGMRRFPESSGRPLRGVRVSVRDANGDECSVGEAGGLFVSGENLALAYWRDDEPDVFSEDEDGLRWLVTGDTGRLLGDGYVLVEGRNDDIFKSRGVRTSVGEIEQAALSIVGVDACALVPPSDDHGAKLFYVGQSMSETVEDALIADLGQEKCPAEVIKVSSIPKTANGKADRHRLGELSSSAINAWEA